MGIGASKIQPYNPDPPGNKRLELVPAKKLLNEMEPKKMLFLGAKEGSLSMVMNAIELGMGANDVDSITNMTALHYAARYGQEHIIEALVKMGAKTNCKQKYGWRPIHEAAMNGKIECLEILLKVGSHVNAKTGLTVKGMTPLHYAVKYGHIDCVKLLVSRGGKVNKTNEFYETPLHMAAMRNEPECLEFLLLNDANVKARTLRDMDAASISAVVGSVPCFKVLVRHGIDINAKYGAGYTMMHTAVLNGREGFVEMLIQQGAEMERKTYDKKMTPLHLGARQGQTRCMRILLKHGANINALSIKNYTPLHHAIKRYQPEAAALLIKEGADINAQTEDLKYTPLRMCIVAKDKPTAILLLKAGADPNIPDIDNKTPLRMAFDDEMRKILTTDYQKLEAEYRKVSTAEKCDK